MIDFFDFCYKFWSKGGVVNLLLLFSAFVIGYMCYHSKYSKMFINGMIGVLPSVGLLGTVIGMIECFTVLSHSATDIGGMSAAISKALITTEVGLGLSIVGTMLLFWKNKKDGTHVSMAENNHNQLMEKIHNECAFDFSDFGSVNRFDEEVDILRGDSGATDGNSSDKGAMSIFQHLRKKIRDITRNTKREQRPILQVD